MGYQTALPSPELRKFILFFWEGDINASENHPFKYISAATTLPQLLFYIKGGFRPEKSGKGTTLNSGAFLHGHTDAFNDYVSKEQAGIFGVQLFPYALPYLFGVPAGELTHQTTHLSLLSGPKGRALEEQVFLSGHFQERVKIISDFFRNSMKEIDERDKAIISSIHSINRCSGMTDASRLASDACLSSRQFERKFRAMTGFAPKSFCRIVKFENALNQLTDHNGSLTSLALASGYYDQAHFNHDFRHFTGYTPSAYLTSLQSQPV